MPRKTAKPTPAPAPAPEAPTAKPKPRMGRKPQVVEVDAKDRALVTVMVAGGIQQREIAAAMGISAERLRKNFRDELDNGKIRANANVVARLYKMTDNNVRAAEFWLTNMDKKNWAHTQKVAVDQGATNLGDRLTRAQAQVRKVARKK